MAYSISYKKVNSYATKKKRADYDQIMRQEA
ncbi:hypothetical protein SAMN04488691_11231 [Haloferax larsenii]|uniref:Uncharacterized protein n=1 Tax=Haloferax larsenii TaxID=302484 RepID=A0A1H7UCV1_HALLR|nr:hypothetical protein SAMN04488691_11231 [Haloferax larsenii]